MEMRVVVVVRARREGVRVVRMPVRGMAGAHASIVVQIGCAMRPPLPGRSLSASVQRVAEEVRGVATSA